MTAIKPKSNTPSLSDDFREAAKPLFEVVGKKASMGIDFLQDEFSSFFKDHPNLNNALDKLQTDLAAGHGLDGIQQFFKTLTQDAPGSSQATKPVPTSPTTP